MTDDTKRAGEPDRVARLRAEIHRVHQERLELSGYLSSTTELLRGGRLFRQSLLDDGLEYLREHLPLMQSCGDAAAALVDKLETFHDEFTAQAAYDAAMAAQALMDSPSLPARTVKLSHRILDVHLRCMYYSWLLGGKLAAWHVAKMAFSLAMDSPGELAQAEFLGTAIAAAMVRGTFNRERAHVDGLSMAARLGGLAQDYLAAKGSPTEEQKGKISEAVGTALRDLMDNPEGTVQLDVFQVLPEPLGDGEIGVEAEEPPRPGLVVVGDLSHLPKRSDGPQGEFLPLANLRLAARPMPDLLATGKALKGRFTWLGREIDRVLETQVGRVLPSLPPLMLFGPPGCGKNELARAFAQAFGIHATEYPCGGTSDATFGSTSRQWHSGRACVPLQAIRRSMTPNPMVILDELEKAGTSRRNGALIDVLLGMLEPGSRKAYFDAFIEAPVDLSGVSFVATCNRVEALKGPLLDRFLVVNIPAPRAQDREVIAQGIVARMREESGLDPRFMPDLDGVELEALKVWKGGSIRPLRRAVERLVALRQSPNLAH